MNKLNFDKNETEVILTAFEILETYGDDSWGHISNTPNLYAAFNRIKSSCKNQKNGIDQEDKTTEINPEIKEYSLRLFKTLKQLYPLALEAHLTRKNNVISRGVTDQEYIDKCSRFSDIHSAGKLIMEFGVLLEKKEPISKQEEQKCKVCPKYHSCQDFSDKDKMIAEKRIEAVRKNLEAVQFCDECGEERKDDIIQSGVLRSYWDCKCGYRNIIKPDTKDLKVTGENKVECKDFRDRGKIMAEQDLEALGLWDCKCGKRNSIEPIDPLVGVPFCSRCGKARSGIIKSGIIKYEVAKEEENKSENWTAFWDCRCGQRNGIELFCSKCDGSKTINATLSGVVKDEVAKNGAVNGEINDVYDDKASKTLGKMVKNGWKEIQYVLILKEQSKMALIDNNGDVNIKDL